MESLSRPSIKYARAKHCLRLGPVCRLNVGQDIEIVVGGENCKFHLPGYGGDHDINLGKNSTCSAQFDLEVTVDSGSFQIDWPQP